MKLNDDFEEWDQEEEEDTAVKPATRVFVFLGLVVVAAIISVILWNMTHRSRDESGIDNSTGEQTVESAPEDNPESGIDAISEESPESGPETVSGESREPEPETVSGEDSGPGFETASEESPESGPEAGSEPAEASGGEPEASASGTMTFIECQDTVTPKDVINLRSAPSTGQADNIVTQATNGEVLTRTGINSDTGWSRLEYNGQTLYAVSRYLTTDLTYQPPVAEPDPNVVSTKDGRTITFTDCDDNISPKEYVNLRLEPSTSEGNATVHCRLDYGQIVHRTGISEDFGWSRVEYDGYVLYVVTSYMYVVEEQ
ncbi:MAG: SH3 domain-containing protein [Acetatifactor sp.]|nr:SH3 domain-containing protein [Acetatifactor sp.]